MTNADDTSVWLVTGASGLLGANAGRVLAGRARRIGLSRSAPPVGAFDETVSVDLLDAAAIDDAFTRIRPNVVLHAAALASHEQCESDPDLAHRLNAVVAGSVASAASAVGARLIHISTDAVFDGSVGGYRETDAPSPFSVYGESKLAGEAQVHAAYPQALIARTNFFGWSPSGTRSILEFFVNNLRAGVRIRGYDDFVVTSLYVDHLVDALWHLASTEAAGVLHVTSQDPLSKYAFGVQVAETFGLDAGLIELSSAAAAGPEMSRARNLSLDTSTAAALLGHPLPTQAAGILAALR